MGIPKFKTIHEVWQLIQKEARVQHESLTFLAPEFLKRSILDHDSFEAAFAFILSHKLSCHDAKVEHLRQHFHEALLANPKVLESISRDLQSYVQRDPASQQYYLPLLFYKGFHAIQVYRFSHLLWKAGNRFEAFFLQSKNSEVFDVDIHPAAKIGFAIFVDHGSGIVIGETAVVGNYISILHGVTLGGTGKQKGKRHPNIEDGVLLGAGAKVLGNVTVGKGAKIGAGSVVLVDIPDHCTAVGVPAKCVKNKLADDYAALKMDQGVYNDFDF